MQRNVLEYLEETVKRVPDKIAFANDKTQLTFQQFSDDIRAIGSELIRKGYQKEPVASSSCSIISPSKGSSFTRFRFS